ncbi:hypothetical protein [Sphingomonas bacterium]|uniref:hypothetical protein n=1 Tax=Sphingomonas bacterium TaxID=1895847 RepID=UPI0015768390|nr:hypothetical protein [Sphingomonas bacterium]
MLFSTPTQFIVLALALVAGWLLGLASHSGGRKWKDRYAREREAHAAARREAEAKLAEANRSTTDARRNTDDRLIQANARIAELEGDNARLPAAPAVVPRTGSAQLPGDTPAYAASAARPAVRTSTGEKRGWFELD